MLILSRHEGESLIIGDDIIVTILDIRGSQVRIGIKAPKYVEVHRQEVYEKIQQQKGDQESEGDSGNAKDEEETQNGLSQL